VTFMHICSSRNMQERVGVAARLQMGHKLAASLLTRVAPARQSWKGNGEWRGLDVLGYAPMLIRDDASEEETRARRGRKSGTSFHVSQNKLLLGTPYFPLSTLSTCTSVLTNSVYIRTRALIARRSSSRERT